jgi:hypothetical protein
MVIAFSDDGNDYSSADFLKCGESKKIEGNRFK